MNKLKHWYIEAFVLAIAWTVVSVLTSQPVAMSTYADVISATVLIVFIQFLFQASPPPGTATYLRLSYLSLLAAGFALVSAAPSVVIVFLSGYVFSLSIVYVIRQIQGA